MPLLAGSNIMLIIGIFSGYQNQLIVRRFWIRKLTNKPNMESMNSNDLGRQNSDSDRRLCIRPVFSWDVHDKIINVRFSACFCSYFSSKSSKFSPAALPTQVLLSRLGFGKIVLSRVGSEDTPPPHPTPKSNIRGILGE